MRAMTHPKHIALAILIAAVVGMGLYWTFTGYNTFEQTRGRDHYSFEYPASMWCTMNHADSYENALNGVRFGGRLSDGSKIVLKVSISGGAHDGIPALLVDRALSVDSRELVERAEVDIAGAQGQVVAYYETGDKPLFVREAYFVHSHRTIDFGIAAAPEHEERVEQVFQRLCDTFEMLP